VIKTISWKMTHFYQTFFVILTYLITSIPFGLVLAKVFSKQDIRQFGSKNIGATNVARVLGKKLGFITLILDSSKGAIMIILARYFFADNQYLNQFLVLVGLVAIIGHTFPIYLNFKGGKGVATGMGVLLAIHPLVGLMFLISWIIIFVFTKTSALASLSSITITVGFTFYSSVPAEEILLVIFLAFVMFIRHKENINRILKGEEYQVLNNHHTK